MRINKFVAQASGLSRRAADQAINQGRVLINKKPANLGDQVLDQALVKLDNVDINLTNNHTTIILNKPVGYVCSRDGQGSKTVYDLLPKRYARLKPIGRLDKNSSGLILLSDDGDLANQLTHPKFEKTKLYTVQLNKPLTQEDAIRIKGEGVQLEDGISRFAIKSLNKEKTIWQARMHEGRNRQIRRTFEGLSYRIIALKRTNFGTFELGELNPAQFSEVY
jgi:23S rRNA pseudouridine2605 synthase